MPDKNVALVRSLYDAFANADLVTIQNAFADDVVAHVNGRSPIAGDYKGRDEVLGFLGQVIALSEGTFKAEPHAFTSDAEHVVVMSTVSGQRTGKSPMSVQGVEIFHVDNEKITEVWFISTDTNTEDEFWS